MTTVVCPTCSGGGLVTVFSGSNRAPGNDSGRDCMVYARCPTCPDDGSGNCVGAGRIPAPQTDVEFLLDVIFDLADQQAMPDDWWQRRLAERGMPTERPV